ncbi:hypothetical protein BOX15_Mlig005612g2 [Macrostomum lignano]|uniref:LRRCT domain-containing protein n=1 Tax=Macrostomum lignano TaxID=282301 RepID=A0A267EKV5_9PLAT|nr:hypothetical protein BOX15_Mlig005612g2 [Macrostomum lignano]
MRSEFFKKWLHNTGSVSFQECKFKGFACSDLGRAFSTSQINELQFIDCKWCQQTTIGNITASQMTISQSVAQKDVMLNVNEITLKKNMSITVKSGWQQARLGRIRPAHLVLSGLELSDSLGRDFLRDAKPYSVQLRRCKLPPGASSSLLQNILRVNDLSLRDTDIEDLPLVPISGVELTTLEVRNCRLDKVNFSRLIYASGKLVSLNLVNASIKQLPGSWSRVANGSILSRLNLVDLSNNLIRFVPFVPNGRAYFDSDHFEVKLGGNPLHCGCELKWLASEDTQVQAVYRNDDPKCVTPKHLAGLRVVEAFRKYNPCDTDGGIEPPEGGEKGSGGQKPDSPPGEAGASLLAIIVAIVVTLIVAVLLLVLCCQLKKRAGRQNDRDKVKYTPASKEDPRSNSDRTTMLRNDESHAGKSVSVYS